MLNGRCNHSAQRPRSGSSLLLLTLGIAALISQGSCARIALPPAPSLNLRQLDLRPLQGRIIVLDPGHGGPEAGAIGRQGLKESEVNLGVALYLWGLLKDAGARPVLTRSTDTALFAGTPFDLRQDLQARADAGNRAGADLFVSIHHNAAAEKGPQNDLMVFYKMSDPLRSRDLAREICSALQARLGPRAVHVQPGNYHVLRRASAPAVLGEASFMSNKQNETRLSFHRTLRLEAEGYFVGILSYFSKGVPVITDLQPSGPVAHPQPELRARCNPGSESESVDLSSVTFILDDKQVKDYSAGKDGLITYRPSAPLANARHRFCLAARNQQGNSSARVCADFEVSLPAQQIKVSPLFPALPADGLAASPLDIEVRDLLDRPVIDNMTVQLSATRGRLLQASVRTEAGRARALLVAAEKPQCATVTATVGRVSSSCTVAFGRLQEALLKLTVLDVGGQPIKNVRVRRHGAAALFTDAGGSAYDRLATDGPVAYSITKRGYGNLVFNHSPAPGTLAEQNLYLEPVDGGFFHGRRIVLDPAAADNATRALIARLGQMIEEAGGTALRTWEHPPQPAAASRVSLSARERAHLFLAIGTDKGSAGVGYYHKSAQGRHLAELICAGLATSGCCRRHTCQTKTSTQYVIIHTEMPAVWVTIPKAAPPQAAAEALYAALRAFLQAGGLGPAGPGR